MDSAQFSHLPPGQYIARAGVIVPVKADTTWDELLGLSKKSQNQAPEGVEALVKKVGWVYAALRKRAVRLLEIPVTWEVNGTTTEKLPIALRQRKLFKLTDTALQATSNAYWLKERNNRTKLIGVNWLNPLHTRPHEMSWAEGNDGRWRYHTYEHTPPHGGSVVYIPYADVIHFTESNFAWEMGDGSAAEATSLAAQILFGINATADNIYDLNGLPVLHITVPAHRSGDTDDMTKLEKAFARIFNPTKGEKGRRTVATSDEVKVVPISMKPSELISQGLTRDQVEAILAAHDVPISQLLSSAANFATAENDNRGFVGSLASRLRDIGEELSYDPDFSALGITLNVQEDEHPALRQDVGENARAFVLFRQGGFTKIAAASLVGIKDTDFGKEVQIFEPDPEPSQPEAATAEEEGDGEAVAIAKTGEQKAFRKWRRKNPAAELSEFVPKFLSAEELEALNAEFS
jgi:hypothetical protein